MTPYINDKDFTDYIHKNLAIPKIYNLLKWTEEIIDKSFAEEIDISIGIDYIFKDANGKLLTVQERFRESKYQQYSDFTIRYRRDNNIDSSRKKSEFYKMKADYFTYGITNCSKSNINQCTDFIKYAVIDLRKVYRMIDDGLIIISDNRKNNCEIVDNKIICPVKYNSDGSSSFFPVEIGYLVKIWGDEIIIKQKGFL